MPKDKEYCIECTYLIGVKSKTKEARYTLSIEQETLKGFVEKSLQIGVPFEDEVSETKFKWYSIVVEQPMELQIITQVQAGEFKCAVFDSLTVSKPMVEARGGEILRYEVERPATVYV